MSGETKLREALEAAQVRLSLVGAWLQRNHGTQEVNGVSCEVGVVEISAILEETLESDHQCPICLKPFEPADLCATDIELGTCHAACLDGSPTVNLETGEPVDGPIPTFRYDEVSE